MKKLCILLILSSFIFSCFEDKDDNPIAVSEINDFVWKGMNAVYLYKDDIPDLANDRFTNNSDYTNYLNSFSSPETLFESLIYNREAVDRFSWITDDYIALEQLFSGVTTSNGMRFGLRTTPNSTNNVFGYVRYVLPNSDAETQGIQRGDIFWGVDGTALTIDNFNSLLSGTTYTINLGTYNNNGTIGDTSDDVVTQDTTAITLNKEAYTENPIYYNSIIEVDGENVGYLMYNGFTTDFDTQLNNTFANFVSNNVQHLVLDLRYNPGGSVNTAILLSSMVTGQLTGEVFSTEQWNSDLQTAFQNQNPDALINYFTNNDEGTPLNSLNLNKVYVLTTGSSASASELVINALEPYINVVQIGTNTAGKYQASITLYDSDDFGRDGANPSHTYAMQPLVLKSLNANGVTDYVNGLIPDLELAEDYGNLGTIGDVNEPLLAAALLDIEQSGRFQPIPETLGIVGDDVDFIPFGREMYVDKVLPMIKQ